MYITLGINVLHVFGNYVFIFGAFGFPQWGLTGVAISTVTSRVVGLVLLYVLFRKSFGERVRLKEYLTFDRPILKEITKVGLPMAGSAISWSFSQLVIIAAIASMGTTMLATKTYMNIMESFAYLAGWSFALAVQIQVGYLYGANKHDKAYRSPFVAFKWGLIITMFNVLMLLLFGKQFLSALTDNDEIVRIGSILLWLNILLQPLKFMNMPVATAINAVGDSKYMMKINMLSMWLIAVGGTFLLGKGLGWMIIGVYLSQMLDELTRGIFVFRRWMSKVKLNIG
jgi:putative MATE family efflux protein